MRLALAVISVLWALAGVSAASAQPSLDPQTLMRIANEEFSRSNLTPQQRARAHEIRAEGLWGLGRIEEAMADLDKAESIDPAITPRTRIMRALIQSRSLRRPDEAIKTLDNMPEQYQSAATNILRGELLMGLGRNSEAVRLLEPIYSGSGREAVSARRLLAQAYFNTGAFTKAVPLYDEMLVAAERNERQYAAIWRFASERMLNRDAATRLRNDTRPSDRLSWPGPIIKYLLGDITADELIRTAGSDMQARSMGGACEAPFFIAIAEEKSGNRQLARSRYEEAVRNCHPGMYERWGAEARLAGLK